MRDKISINVKKVFKSNDNMVVFFEDFHSLVEGLYKCNQIVEEIAPMERSEINSNQVFDICMQKIIGMAAFLKHYKEIFEKLQVSLDLSYEEVGFLFKKMRGETDE